MSDSSRPHGLQPPRLLHPWDFPGKSTGVGCHRLLLLESLNTGKCQLTEQISLTHSLYPFTVLTHCTILLIILSLKLMTWRRQWQPTPVLLPGKSHGRRSLVGCNPRGREESDTTERLPFHFSLSCIGEGNVNPLQCTCLENPRDGGAWWAAIYGVAKSRTQLK